MDVSSLLQRLSYGPLTGLSMNNGDGTIADANIPALISFANEGLLHLYSKFVLNEKEVIITQDETITRYTISSANSVSNLAANPTAPYSYVTDTVASPFTDDLLKILGVFDQNGCKVPLNDEGQVNGVFTPKRNILQVPIPIQGQPLYLLYQAKHPTLTDTTATNTVIDIPEVLEEALISYVGYKVFYYMNGQDETAKATDLLGRFNNIIAEVAETDMVNSSISTSQAKFHQRGFC